MKIIIFSLFITVLCACSTNKHGNTNDSNYVLKIVKENYEVTNDTLISPIYNFSIYLHSSRNVRIKRIDLDALKFDSRYYFKHEDKYNSEIKSISEAINKGFDIPFFLIENKKGELKYYYNIRKFSKSHLLNLYGKQLIINEPSRTSEFIFSLNTPPNKIRVSKGQDYFLGNVDIYQYDLKINLSDEKVRFHYIFKNEVVSSNWIDISEKSKRLNKLFEY